MIKITILSIGVLLLVASCSSIPKQVTPETTQDVVISRIDDLKARPSWLRESEPFKIQSGTVISLGQTTIPGDNRTEAGFRIAENNAKASIATAIEQRLEFIFQQAEENTGMDATQARFIGAEASKLTSSSLRLTNRYWEKVATTTDDGQRVTRYRIFATVTMPESDFKRAIIDAIRAGQGKGTLSKDFANKVDAQWNKFTGEDDSKKPESDKEVTQ